MLFEVHRSQCIERILIKKPRLLFVYVTRTCCRHRKLLRSGASDL